MTDILAPEDYVALVAPAAWDVFRLTGYEQSELESEGLVILVEQCRKWDGTKESTAKPGTWLSVILRYRLLDWVRNQWGRNNGGKRTGWKRTYSLQGLTEIALHPDSAGSDWTPDFLVDHRASEAVNVLERLVAAQNTLSRMPPKQAEIVRMYAIEGMTMTAIGAWLGVTEARICQVIARSRAQFRAAERG